MIVLAALVGSYMVSYARARSEGIGYSCQTGLMERPERMLLLASGGLLGERFFLWFLIALAALVHFTALQRIYHVWRQTTLGRAENTGISRNDISRSQVAESPETTSTGDH
jgi:hypothetical protein